jgi:hypothetical protein
MCVRHFESAMVVLVAEPGDRSLAVRSYQLPLAVREPDLIAPSSMSAEANQESS